MYRTLAHPATYVAGSPKSQGTPQRIQPFLRLDSQRLDRDNTEIHNESDGSLRHGHGIGNVQSQFFPHALEWVWDKRSAAAF